MTTNTDPIVFALKREAEVADAISRNWQSDPLHNDPEARFSHAPVAVLPERHYDRVVATASAEVAAQRLQVNAIVRRSNRDSVVQRIELNLHRTVVHVDFFDGDYAAYTWGEIVTVVAD